MRFLYPIGNIFPKSGGTIAGNLVVSGSLQVSGQSIFNDKIKVYYNQASPEDACIELHPQDNSGIYLSVCGYKNDGSLSYAFAGDTLNNLGVGVVNNGYIGLPHYMVSQTSYIFDCSVGIKAGSPVINLIKEVIA